MRLIYFRKWLNVCYDFVEHNKAPLHWQNISHVSMCFHDPRDNEQNGKNGEKNTNKITIKEYVRALAVDRQF